MKLIKENTYLMFIMMMSGIIVIDILFLIVSNYSFKSGLLRVLHDTAEITKEKGEKICELLNESLLKLIIKYESDLKIIGKHLLLFKSINKNTNFYRNYQEDFIKKLISNPFVQMIKDSTLRYYYNRTSYSLDYINHYELLFHDKTESFTIINALMNESEHNELNMISYYSIYGDLHLDTRKLYGKYLISILKTIFIKRYINKRAEMDYKRFLLFYDSDCFIYPPESYNNTYFHAYSLSKKKERNLTFPADIYQDDLNIDQKRSFYFNIIFSNNSFFLCLAIPYIEGNQNSHICLEINFDKIFSYKIPQDTNHQIQTLVVTEQNLVEFFYDAKKIENSDLIKYYSDKNRFGNYTYENEKNSTKKFFHYLYYSIFSDQTVAKDSESLNMKNIFQEYDTIVNRITTEIKQLEKKINREDNKKVSSTFDINRTICNRNIDKNNTVCESDTFIALIYPIIIEYSSMNENFFIDENAEPKMKILYTVAIIATNSDLPYGHIRHIMTFKMIKLFAFFLILGLLSICAVFIIMMHFLEGYFDSIYIITTQFENFFIDDEIREECLNPKNKLIASSKEVDEIMKVYSNMNENYSIKNALKSKTDQNKINQEFKNNFDNIKNKEIKNIYMMIIAYFHFKNSNFEKAEDEFGALMNSLTEQENEYCANNDYQESKIKDIIRRTSESDYINEYFPFTGVNEILLGIIKIKLVKQKIVYLHGMSIYNKILKTENNKDSNINEKDNEQAIQKFKECRDINKLLGTNPIKQIFSLIMMSKCYIKMIDKNIEDNNYKNAITCLLDALKLFESISKFFVDDKFFNPKIVLFSLNYTFQSIMSTIAQVTYSYQKYCATSWIIMQIYETSPFLLNDLFYEDSFIMRNSLNILLQTRKDLDYKKAQELAKYHSKIYSRIEIRMKGNTILKSKLNFYNSINITNTNLYGSNIIRRTSIRDAGSIFKRSKKRSFMDSVKDTITTKNRNQISNIRFCYNKIVTICISEKVISNNNGAELKDILIKYLKKFFTNNDKDKFSLIQFTYNGKRSLYFKPEKLDDFIKKFKTSKKALRLIDQHLCSNETVMTELVNIFDFIVKQQANFINSKINILSPTYSLSHSNVINSSPGNSYKASNHNSNKNMTNTIYSNSNSNSNTNKNDNNLTDNIILLFIQKDELRFNRRDECVDTVNALNLNNYTVVLFCFDKIINTEKVMSIYSLLRGLFDGYLFQVQKYQQIKQTLMNFSTRNIQENFNLNIENSELTL